MAKVTTDIVLDKRIPMKDGSFRVKLRVTYQRKQIYYPTKYTLSETDFEKTKTIKPRLEFKELALSFNAIETKAKEIIDDLPVFTFNIFEKRFLSNSNRTDVFDSFDRVIEKLGAEKRIGTQSNNECARNSLISFAKGIPPTSNKGLSKEQILDKKKQYEKENRPPLTFINVTVDFLKEYERWMKNHGRSRTTIGIYLRPLRALFNEAIDSGDLDKECYPFGKRKYKIPSGRNVKKALDTEIIALLFNYTTDIENEQWSRDMWMLSYLGNGINMKDIALLKRKYIDKEFITFIRAKTESTTVEDQKPIIISITPWLQDIIDRWGNKDKSPEAYVFSILKEDMTAHQIHAAVKQAIKKVNKYMRRIADKLGIEDEVRTNEARHSVATILDNAGVPISHIGELLGHGIDKTTKNYIAGIKNSKRAELTKHLTAFLKKKEQSSDEDDPMAAAIKSLLEEEVTFPKLKLTCIKTLKYEGGEFRKGDVLLFQDNKHLDPNSGSTKYLQNFGPYIYLNQIAELLIVGTTNPKIKEHWEAEVIAN